MNRSLRCFVLGWIALVPLLGLGCAAIGLHLFFKTRATATGQWNPAAKYLHWGLTLCLLGSVLSLMLGTVVLLAWVQS